ARPRTGWTVVFTGQLGAEERAVAATRTRRQYVVALYGYEFAGTQASVTYDASDWFPADAPYLVGSDTVTLHGLLAPAGVSTTLDRTKSLYILYWDPPSPGEQLEVTPTASACTGYDDVYYGNVSYRQYNYYLVLPQTPAAGDLVEFEPAATLAQLFGYTYDAPPPVTQVLASIGADGSPVRLGAGAARMLGLRLTTAAETPALPGGLDPNGLPYVTSGRSCGVAVQVRPLE